MKIKDAIYKVDKSSSNESWADMEDFADVLGFDYLSYNQEFSAQVKKYWLKSWQCTDTHVGLAVYYFKDEPVAVSYQSARKSDESIEFVSKEASDVMRAFIVSLQEKEGRIIPLCDLEEDIGESYTITYRQQILKKRAVYNGQDVDVVHEKVDYSGVSDWESALVKFTDGTVKRVPMRDVKIPYHLHKG